MAEDSIVLERRFVPENTLIMRQGDPGNCAYLIQSGSVNIFAEYDGKRVDLATLGYGQIFGEMSLIFDEPRTASVKTLEDTNLIIITRQSFKQKLERSDATISAIVHMLTERMVTANNVLIKQKTDTAGLMQTTRIIYQNVLSRLPEDRQEAFQNEVLPKMDSFLNALESFAEE